MRVQGLARRRDGSQPRWWRRINGSRTACAHLTCRTEGPRLDAEAKDADRDLVQFAPRRCCSVPSGTSTLRGQPEEGSLAMGSSSDGAASVRRGAILPAKRHFLSRSPFTGQTRATTPHAACDAAAVSAPLVLAQAKVPNNGNPKSRSGAPQAGTPREKTAHAPAETTHKRSAVARPLAHALGMLSQAPLARDSRPSLDEFAATRPLWWANTDHACAHLT